MELLHKSVCERSLDFQPQKNWPIGWPAYAWDKKLVAGFTSSCDKALNFKAHECDFLSLFHSCYPELNCLELGRIVTQWKNPPFVLWSAFFKLYRLHQDEQVLRDRLQILLATPPLFQKWVVNKRVHLNELSILEAINHVDDLQFMFQWLSQKDVSYTLGVKALEWAGELILMGFSEKDILRKDLTEDATAMVQSIELLRKPHTLSHDQAHKKAVECLALPAQVRATWNRKGDKSGLEIKLWCQNQKELSQQLKTLNKTPLFNFLNTNN